MDDLSTLSHVSLGTADLERAGAFYDRVLAPLGCRRIQAIQGGIGWGRRWPEFWIQLPFDGRPFTTGNGTHIAFLARSRAEVDAFHAAGLACGGECDGPPGERPQYEPGYYAAFLRDPDGHKIEAMHLDLG
jgi:catechol 2,3-dioxygenase-like lactoylglutathione lyase family enzyme